MNPAPTRTPAPFGSRDVLTAALEQARAEFAIGGDRRALELAFRIESRLAPPVALAPTPAEETDE